MPLVRIGYEQVAVMDKKVYITYIYNGYKTVYCSSRESPYIDFVCLENGTKPIDTDQLHKNTEKWTIVYNPRTQEGAALQTLQVLQHFGFLAEMNPL